MIAAPLLEPPEGLPPAPGFRRFALSCPCGHAALRVLAHPAAAQGPGGAILRVLRELWISADASQPALLGPFGWACDRCSLRGELFDPRRHGHAAAHGRPGLVGRGAREAYRCRPCRRTAMRVVVGFSYRQRDWERGAPGADAFDAFELDALCLSCRSWARLAQVDCGREGSGWGR